MIKYFKFAWMLPVSYLKMLGVLLALLLIVAAGLVGMGLIFILAAFMIPYYLVKEVWKR